MNILLWQEGEGVCANTTDLICVHKLTLHLIITHCCIQTLEICQSEISDLFPKLYILRNMDSRGSHYEVSILSMYISYPKIHLHTYPIAKWLLSLAPRRCMFEFQGIGCAEFFHAWQLCSWLMYGRWFYPCTRSYLNQYSDGLRGTSALPEYIEHKCFSKSVLTTPFLVTG